MRISDPQRWPSERVLVLEAASPAPVSCEAASILPLPEPQAVADLRAHPPSWTALPTQASESAAVTRKSATSALEIEPGTGESSARLT